MPRVLIRRKLCLSAILFPFGASAQVSSHMDYSARGSFVVEIKPLGEMSVLDGVSLGRMALTKTFEGDFVGTGQGEMLTALTPNKGSAGYVAIERLSGDLKGRKGTFVLQHSGSMNEGVQSLSIAIVPGSGTGELSGIEGVFKLVITGGKHLYSLEYTLPR